MGAADGLRPDELQGLLDSIELPSSEVAAARAAARTALEDGLTARAAAPRSGRAREAKVASDDVPQEVAAASARTHVPCYWLLVRLGVPKPAGRHMLGVLVVLSAVAVLLLYEATRHLGLALIALVFAGIAVLAVRARRTILRRRRSLRGRNPLPLGRLLTTGLTQSEAASAAQSMGDCDVDALRDADGRSISMHELPQPHPGCL
eukprot:3220248-Prymnesium_polylepis.1